MIKITIVEHWSNNIPDKSKSVKRFIKEKLVELGISAHTTSVKDRYFDILFMSLEDKNLFKLMVPMTLLPFINRCKKNCMSNTCQQNHAHDEVYRVG